MNTIDKVLLEWSLKTDKGYPDLNSKEDMDLFESMFGIRLNEEEVQKVEGETQKKVNDTVKILLNAMENISEKYSQYLSVLHLFDPNSLGTLSEVLFAELLSKQEGIRASHTGAGQGLADIRVNDVGISIKTTGGTNAIFLGSDLKTVSTKDNVNIVTQLKNISNNPDNLTAKQLIDEFKAMEGTDKKRAGEQIKARIDAIVNKLAGPGNEEVFLWAEKVIENKMLKAVVLHVTKYDKDKVEQELMNAIPKVTDKGKGKAWGLLDSNGGWIVQGNDPKNLNIMPGFVRKTTKDSAKEITLAGLDVTGFQAKDLVNKGMFGALDTIYAELTKVKNNPDQLKLDLEEQERKRLLELSVEKS